LGLEGGAGGAVDGSVAVGGTGGGARRARVEGRRGGRQERVEVLADGVVDDGAGSAEEVCFCSHHGAFWLGNEFVTERLLGRFLGILLTSEGGLVEAELRGQFGLGWRARHGEGGIGYRSRRREVV